jgi:hypothetical protein
MLKVFQILLVYYKIHGSGNYYTLLFVC